MEGLSELINKAFTYVKKCDTEPHITMDHTMHWQSLGDPVIYLDFYAWGPGYYVLDISQHGGDAGLKASTDKYLSLNPLRNKSEELEEIEVDERKWYVYTLKEGKWIEQLSSLEIGKV